MISIHQFKRWQPDVQLDYLNSYGVALGISLVRKDMEVILFSLHDFYVRISYKRKTNKIKEVSCFRSMKKLEPFLDQVNIDEIIILLSYI
jgi:hypothetical protein